MSKKFRNRLILALIIILITSLLSCLIQTNNYKVRVREMYLVTDQQQQLRALAFIPRNASQYNKLPCVITGHGGFHSAEMQDAACIELSRRGVVVIAIDMYSHGLSSNAPKAMAVSEMTVGLGMQDMLEYVLGNNMDFIDTQRIGLMGHSMGTRSIAAMLKNYANARMQSDDVSFGAQAVFMTGKSPNLLKGFWDKLDGINIGVEYGVYEEDGYSSSSGNGNILCTPEALEMINHVDPSVKIVENGKYYGNKEDGTLRVLFQPKTSHLTDFIAPAVTTECIEFFTRTLNIRPRITATNHVYFYRQLISLCGFVSLFALVLPFGDMLLTTPAFSELKSKPVLKNQYNKKKFLLGLLFVTACSFLGFLLTNYMDTKHILFKPNPMTNSNWFPLNEANIVIVWLFIFAIGNFIWFHFSASQENDGESFSDRTGLKISGRKFAKVIGAAAIIVGLVYVIVWFCEFMFQVDFRFWKVAVKLFNREKLVYMFEYLPFWFLFMLSVSLLTNNLWNFETKHEGRQLLAIGFGLAFAGILIWLLQYVKLFLGGTTLWTNMNGVASVALRNWVVVLAPFMLRNFYKLTGKNWLGPVTLSVLFTLISVTTTSAQHPMF